MFCKKSCYDVCLIILFCFLVYWCSCRLSNRVRGLKNVAFFCLGQNQMAALIVSLVSGGIRQGKVCLQYCCNTSRRFHSF